MDDKVQCRICGKWLKSITTLHLKSSKCNGKCKTTAEYKAMFPNAPLFSKLTLQRLSEANKGTAPWSKGYTKETHPSIMSTSQKLKGKTTWNKNLTKDTDERVASMAEKISGSNHPKWIDGSSYSYTRRIAGFTEEKTSMTYNRDKGCCQLCDVMLLSEGCKDRMAVHHIDYDYTNNHPSNLILLCAGKDSCHMKVHKTKTPEYWMNYFIKYQEARGIKYIPKED